VPEEQQAAVQHSVNTLGLEVCGTHIERHRQNSQQVYLCRWRYNDRQPIRLILHLITMLEYFWAQNIDHAYVAKLLAPRLADRLIVPWEIFDQTCPQSHSPVNVAPASRHMVRLDSLRLSVVNSGHAPTSQVPRVRAASFWRRYRVNGSIRRPLQVHSTPRRPRTAAGCGGHRSHLGTCACYVPDGRSPSSPPQSHPALAAACQTVSQAAVRQCPHRRCALGRQVLS
jgi:hypothetical protein